MFQHLGWHTGADLPVDLLVVMIMDPPILDLVKVIQAFAPTTIIEVLGSLVG